MKKIKVGIIGTGNIGIDLAERLLRDERFEVIALVGRRDNSPGIARFKGRIDYLFTKGVREIDKIISKVDGFFDATSTFDHVNNWEYIKQNDKWVIDLTPSKIGSQIVPSLLGKVKSFNLSTQNVTNYSMVTCGGQSSAPLLFAMSKFSTDIQEIEVSSSIASKSAGPATRINIDNYIESTQSLIENISQVKNNKAILVINPVDPPVMMRTTVNLMSLTWNLRYMEEEICKLENVIKEYVPGYDLIVKPHVTSQGAISATVKVTGAGYFLPEYAGNLDIINAAAVETAYLHAAHQNSLK
jgi:acetaldehyde dehydrogenase (acetylating)